MITSVVVVAAVVFNDAAAMTPIVTNYCDGRREGKAKVKTKINCLGEKKVQFLYPFQLKNPETY